MQWIVLAPKAKRPHGRSAMFGECSDRDRSDFVGKDTRMRIINMTLGALLAAGPALAQDGPWTLEASLYAWVPGVSTSVDTRFGTVDADTSGSDAFADLDMAFMGTLQARKGKWGLIGDLLYADLSASQKSPFGLRFKDAEIGTKVAAFSGYATYRVFEENGVAVDVGGGFRAFGVDVDADLNSADARPGFSSSGSENWVDPLIAARVIAPVTDKWFVSAFADFGGTSASDQTWQAFGSVGYKFSEHWSAQLGYRYMSIEKKIDGADTTIDLSGPLLGASFYF